MYDEWAGGGFSVKIKNTKCVLVYCLVVVSGGGTWPARAQPGQPIPASSSVITRSYLLVQAGRWGGSERNRRAVLVWSRADGFHDSRRTTDLRTTISHQCGAYRPGWLPYVCRCSIASQNRRKRRGMSRTIILLWNDCCAFRLKRQCLRLLFVSILVQ